MRKRLPFLALLGAATLSSLHASADVQHTIARGHTIEAIANRYRVTAKSIIEANHLKDVKRLRVGDVLTIPNVDPPKKKAREGKDKDGKAKSGKDGRLGNPRPSPWSSGTPGPAAVTNRMACDNTPT